MSRSPARIDRIASIVIRSGSGSLAASVTALSNSAMPVAPGTTCSRYACAIANSGSREIALFRVSTASVPREPNTSVRACSNAVPASGDFVVVVTTFAPAATTGVFFAESAETVFGAGCGAAWSSDFLLQATANRATIR